MELHYRDGDHVATVRVRKKDGRFVVTVDGRSHDVRVVRAAGGEVDLVLDGRPVRAFTAEDGARRIVKLVGGGDARSFQRAETRAPRRRRARAAGDEGLTANMHGQVAAVLVKEGDIVERGATLVVLEAMKMELRVVAPHRGRVRSVACKVGEVVERGRVLVELHEEPEAETGARE
jgi:3-methylcrotonyl-CoA carboxylase alpha subunit